MNNNTFPFAFKTRLVLAGLVATASSFGLCSNAVAGVLYKATDIGTIAPNNYSVSANRINNLGQVVGRDSVFSGNPLTSNNTTFIWQNGARTTNLTLTGTKVGGVNDGTIVTMPGRGGLANNINDAGVIIGTADEDAVLPTDRAMLWQPDGAGGYTLTINDFGGIESYFYSINESNQIAGQHIYATGKVNAIYWENGIKTDLPSLGGDGNTARGINDSAQIVGYVDADGADNLTNTYNAAYWEKDAGGNWVLNNLGNFGGTQSYARSINNNSQIVGQIVMGTDPLTLTSNPYIYENGVKTDLGSLGGTRGDALEINSLGQIVGNSYVDATNTIQHAFLWQEGEMLDLNSIARGLDGWTLTSAVSINDRGDIVARATNPNYTYVNSLGQVVPQTRSFVLTRTPEGNLTTGLVCFGGLIIGSANFRRQKSN
jgi:probable HAF family extracellular repeat protein